MRNRNSQNLKLGIFILLGITIFVLAVYFIGNKQNLFGTNARVFSVFKNVNGLQTGNNVRFAGVNVGTVKDITIVNDTSIVVDMLISEKTMHLIKENTMATVNSDGLVGSMVVNLIPGDSINSPRLNPGDTLESISKIATADMLTTLNTTNENAALLTADLLKITNSINKGEGTIGALIKDEEMATNIKQSIEGLRKTTNEASGSIHELNKLIASVDLENGLMGVLLNDTIAAKNISEVIEDLNQSAEEIRLMTANLHEFSADLKSSEGALNYVINDTTFVNHLDATLKNAEEASKKFDENMEALQHNFLFRGYFRRLERKKVRALEELEEKD